MTSSSSTYLRPRRKGFLNGIQELSGRASKYLCLSLPGQGFIWEPAQAQQENQGSKQHLLPSSFLAQMGDAKEFRVVLTLHQVLIGARCFLCILFLTLPNNPTSGHYDTIFCHFPHKKTQAHSQPALKAKSVFFKSKLFNQDALPWLREGEAGAPIDEGFIKEVEGEWVLKRMASHLHREVLWEVDMV